jgi:hypothetical protein
MKINRTTNSETAASEILAFIQGDEDTTASRQDAVVSISEDGDLLFYNAACGTDDSETVLIDRLESDSMGDGWESATAADVIEYLESIETPERDVRHYTIEAGCTNGETYDGTEYDAMSFATEAEAVAAAQEWLRLLIGEEGPRGESHEVKVWSDGVCVRELATSCVRK